MKVILFLYCDLGQTMTNQFDGFNDELCRYNWYLFPIEMQHMLVIIMANTQQPAIVQGFGNIMCTRDAFKKVGAILK